MRPTIENMVGRISNSPRGGYVQFERPYKRNTKALEKVAFYLANILREVYRRQKDRNHNIFSAQVRENSGFCEMILKFRFTGNVLKYNFL